MTSPLLSQLKPCPFCGAGETRPLALDLFCGAGGASMGLHRAGFDVIGVDIKPQPRYPFRFVQADALNPPFEFAQFDFIWASPPCQAYIRGGTVAKDKAPRLIEPTRNMLASSDTPFVIENVPGAPIRADLILCGSMFGLGVRRHRWFEGRPALPPFAPACDHSKPITGVYGHAHGKAGAWPGMLPSTPEVWAREMQIDWMTPHEISQAIPPAYSEFIGRSAISQWNARAGGGE